MSMSAHRVIGRLSDDVRLFLDRHVLGLQPDPETVAPPRDVSAVVLPNGIDRSDANGPAWILEREHLAAWPKRRTAIGAQAYRFERNAEYDCGWRLVDVASRYVRARHAVPLRTDERQTVSHFDLVTIVPPPLVCARVSALPWLAQRLAAMLHAEYRDDVIRVNAPYAQHPDMVARLPVTPTELFAIDEARAVSGRGVLLCDRRWHSGRTMTILTKLLARHGAGVTRLTWLD